MSAPNSHGLLGDAMYQAHFGDRGNNEASTQSRFFSTNTNTNNTNAPNSNSPTCVMTGGNQHFSQCVYMMCPNGTPTPMFFTTPGPAPISNNGNIISPAPTSPNNNNNTEANQFPLQVQQQQPTFVVNLADGQSFPYVPVQQVMLAKPGPVNSTLLRTNNIVNSTNNLRSEGCLGGPVNGCLPSQQASFLIPQQLNSATSTVPLSASPVNQIPMSPLSFVQHFSTSPMAQNGNNYIPEVLCNNGESTEINNVSINGEPIVEVYASDFASVISLPASTIMHRPPPSLGVSRLVLCRKYVPGQPDSCWKGNMCKFVHADPTGAPRSPIHVNYAWKSIERCTYPHLPPGEVIVVLAPNGRQPTETVPSERVLVTRGSLNRKNHVGPLSRCAHYYFNRLCNRGENCNFIHTIHIDPNVEVDFKRAPASMSIAPIKKRTSRRKSSTSCKSNDINDDTTPNIVSDTLVSNQTLGTTTVVSGNLDASSSSNIPATSPAFYLVVPQNTGHSLSPSLSVSSVGNGSLCSSTSGATNPIEWSFVDNLESNIWSEGDITPRF